MKLIIGLSPDCSKMRCWQIDDDVRLNEHRVVRMMVMSSIMMSYHIAGNQFTVIKDRFNCCGTEYLSGLFGVRITDTFAIASEEEQSWFLLKYSSTSDFELDIPG